MVIPVQQLRAVAALMVVAHHTNWTRTMIGASGVDLFFVISGFIMMHVAGREPSPVRFLAARARRIWPLYALVTLFVASREGASLESISLSLAFWPFVPPLGMPVVFQGWTLSYEVLFYLLFAAALALPARQRLWALSATITALSLIGAVAHPPDPVLAAITHPIMLEFVAGCWLWRAWRAGRLPARGWPLIALGVLMLAMQAGEPEPSVWRALLWGVPQACIMAGALRVRARLTWLGPVGDASYALYLTHWLVVTALAGSCRSLPLVLALPLLMGACVAVALAVHWGIERPVNRLLRWGPSARAAPATPRPAR